MCRADATPPAPADAVSETTGRVLRRGSNFWLLAVRLAGRLIADNGLTRVGKAGDLAKEVGFRGASQTIDGQPMGSRAGVAVSRVVRALRDLGLVRRHENLIIADSLADVAAWLADELDQHDPAKGGSDVPG